MARNVNKWGVMPVALYLKGPEETPYTFSTRWRRGWPAQEFSAQVKPDLKHCTFRRNKTPVELLHYHLGSKTVTKSCTYEEFKCPIKQWNCPVQYRVATCTSLDGEVVAVYATSCLHVHFVSYESSLFSGEAISPAVKSDIRLLMRVGQSRPLDIARALPALGVPPVQVPSAQRISRYMQSNRDQAAAGLRSCLAGLAKEYEEHNYYATLFGPDHNEYTGYAIPGVDLCQWSTTSFGVVYTSDRLCKLAVSPNH